MNFAEGEHYLGDILVHLSPVVPSDQSHQRAYRYDRIHKHIAAVIPLDVLLHRRSQGVSPSLLAMKSSVPRTTALDKFFSRNQNTYKVVTPAISIV